MEVGHVWLIGPRGVAEGGDFGTAVATAVDDWSVCTGEPRCMLLHQERDVPGHPVGCGELRQQAAWEGSERLGGHGEKRR